LLITNNIRLAKFIRRPNRFQGYVEIDGEELMVHVPNTGRNREILVPGYTVVLREENNPLRKTKYDLIAGYKGDRLINIDSQIPNKVVEEALKQGKIESLRKYTNIKREKTFGNSRFDFKLEDNEGNEYYLEVKGVTFEDKGKTSFPDAPTERGRKHLLELVEVLESGRGAGVLFLIQMDSVDYFTPYDEMDKLFGEALRYAKHSGVDIFAYDCKLSNDFITLNEAVEVRL
jgi:sugar fermentation stimulation protein A